ncbi:hypothetical protein XENOCAPTIV_011974 [Xenoophorus captivus]|uniref:Secreted protein n=1 Tax=Xenoophorus captivus TaxID=1517983 RepID=A0ABV0Q9J2_9TELE
MDFSILLFTDLMLLLLHRTLNLSAGKCTEQFGVLTFGMIPHITQKRRAENNIHHTGRIKGSELDAKKMGKDRRPFGSLPDNLCFSGLEKGPKRLQGPHTLLL